MSDPITTTAPAPTAASPRIHGLDALRALALGLGIVLHSFLAFIPDTGWLITDAVTSPLAALPVYLIHLFRMTVFMLLAGYFGRMVLHRRGPAGYLRDRLLRIGLPLIAFWPFAVVSLGIVAVIGAQVRGLPTPALPPERTDVHPLLQVFAPGQLWFLVVLLQCVLIMLALRALAVAVVGAARVDAAAERLGTVLSSRVGVLVAAAPYALGLAVQGGGAGITEPFTVLPTAPSLLAYGGAFAAGWALHARSDALIRVGRGWPITLVAGLVAAAVGLLPGLAAQPPAVGCAVTALAGTALAYGLLGAFATVLDRRRAVVRYLADASYWVYLLHLPVLVAVHIPLADLAWPIPVKLAALWTISGAVLLLSYDVLVRSTWVGRWLNGHRRRSLVLRRG